MKPKDPKVIAILNDVLTAELTAINQYFVHAEMDDNWGYERLHARLRKQALGEMRHAETLIERILFFEGVPNVQKLGKVAIGETVPEQLRADLALEMEAVPRLNQGIAELRRLGDEATADLLEDILESEEEHVNWLEAQRALIGQVGEAAYLAEQIRDEEG